MKGMGGVGEAPIPKRHMKLKTERRKWVRNSAKKTSHFPKREREREKNAQPTASHC